MLRGKAIINGVVTRGRGRAVDVARCHFLAHGNHAARRIDGIAYASPGGIEPGTSKVSIHCLRVDGSGRRAYEYDGLRETSASGKLYVGTLE